MSGSSVNHGHGGYEKSDFTFVFTAWLIPFSLVLLVAYTLVCLYGYRGALTAEVARKVSTESQSAEVKAAALKDAEILGSYVWKDQASGKVQVPIDRAMELVVKGLNAADSSSSGPEGERSAP